MYSDTWFKTLFIGIINDEKYVSKPFQLIQQRGWNNYYYTIVLWHKPVIPITTSADRESVELLVMPSQFHSACIYVSQLNIHS